MKKKIIILTAVAALAVASIGSTLAYFNAQTGDLNNVMVASDGFKDGNTLLVNLNEEFGYGTTATYVGGADVPAINDVVPGQVITKRPYMTNTSKLQAYVAVTITLNSNVKTYSDVNFNNTDWDIVWTDDTHGVAYYKTALAATTGQTADLFSTVTIKSALNDQTLPDDTQLTIDLQGYAVQVQANANAIGADVAAQAKAALQAEFTQF